MFVLISTLFLLPIYCASAPFTEENYEVNPDYYELGVVENDVQTYIFNRIRTRKENEPEIHKMNMTLPLSGVMTNFTVYEGTKVTLEVIDINETYITEKYIFYNLNGEKFHPDYLYINLSRLDLSIEYQTRTIMTINKTLIEEVYAGTSWNYNFYDNFVRFERKVEDLNYFSRENYEYDLTTGFMVGMRRESGDENYYSEVEVSAYETWNPDHFELGVNVGDTNTYVLKKYTWFDSEGPEPGYYHDLHIPIMKGGDIQDISLYEGDEIIVKVISIDYLGYLELELTYNLIHDAVSITDDQHYFIDKSTAWAPRLFGPPLINTINRTLIDEVAPPEVKIVDDVLSFVSEHTNGWHDRMEGSWNLTTGWLRCYYNIQIEDPYGKNITRHEMELIDKDLELIPKDFVGVKAGDSITYEFKEIIMPEATSTASGAAVSVSDKMIISFEVDGQPEEISVQPGDTMTVEVEKVESSNVTVIITIDSSIDGEVETDPMEFDIAEVTFDRGPPFIVPTDETMVKEKFAANPDAEVSIGADGKVEVEVDETEGNKRYETLLVYDLDTGWLTEYRQTVTEDGEIIQKIVAISTDVSTTDDTSKSDLPGLTPLPLFPVICGLFLVAGLLRKRKRV